MDVRYLVVQVVGTSARGRLTAYSTPPFVSRSTDGMVNWSLLSSCSCKAEHCSRCRTASSSEPTCISSPQNMHRAVRVSPLGPVLLLPLLLLLLPLELLEPAVADAGPEADCAFACACVCVCVGLAVGLGRQVLLCWSQCDFWCSPQQ
jgi:hypothetical protein